MIREGSYYLRSTVIFSMYFLGCSKTFVRKWFSVNETHTVNRLTESMSHKPSGQDPWWLDQDIQIDLTTSPPWGRPGFLWGEATVDFSFSTQLSGPYLPGALKASALQYWAALCPAQMEPGFPALSVIVPGGYFSACELRGWVNARDD